MNGEGQTAEVIRELGRPRRTFGLRAGNQILEGGIFEGKEKLTMYISFPARFGSAN